MLHIQYVQTEQVQGRHFQNRLSRDSPNQAKTRGTNGDNFVSLKKHQFELNFYKCTLPLIIKCVQLIYLINAQLHLNQHTTTTTTKSMKASFCIGLSALHMI